MNTKKIVLTILVAIIAGTVLWLSFSETTKARDAYRETVMKFVELDTDLKDYDIDSVRMTDCTVETSEMKMRGTRLDTLRLSEYEGYSQWINIKLGAIPFTDPKEIRDFGMWVASTGAHTNFGVAYHYCIEKVAPHNEHVILDDDGMAQRVAVNVQRLKEWFNGLSI